MTVLADDVAIIKAIVERGGKIALFDTLAARMTLTCIHNDTPLDLQGFYESSPTHFIHDFFGILANAVYTENKVILANQFCPRYTK